MKILFVNRVYPPSLGATGRVLSEIKGVLQQTEKVDVLSTQSTSRVYSLFELFFKSLLVSKKQYDVVVLMTDPPFLVLLAPLFRLKGIKVIHWVQDVYPDLFEVFERPSFNKDLFRKIHKFLLKFVNEFIVIGRDMKSFIADNYDVSADKISVIYNWAEEYVKPMDIQKDEFIVMYSGNFGRVYDFDKVLAVAEKLKDENDIVFYLIGEGYQKKRIEKTIQENNLTNVRVFESTTIEEHVKSINHADLHILAMKAGTKGLMVPCKAYASLTAGIPVLFSGDEGSEIDLLLREYDCGFIAGNSDQLANIIKESYKNNDLLKEKGSNALKVNENFGLGRAVKQFEKVIEKCIVSN